VKTILTPAALRRGHKRRYAGFVLTTLASLVTVALLAAPVSADVPVVTVPSDITAEATSGSGASVSFPPATSDQDGVIPTCDHSSGDVFPLGTTTVTCSATNADGETGTGSFNITVQDTTPPNVSTPGDITREATSATGATVTFAASANDAVDGSITPSCSPGSGSTFAIGTTTVTCTATDTHGNPGSATFHVVVQDTSKPAVSVPPNISQSTTNPGGLAVTYSVSASDTVDGAITPSCSPASGANFAIGTTTVNCSATDAHGNTGTGSFTITVTLVDTTKPVVTVPSDITTTTTVASGKSVTYPAATANDNVDGAITPTCTPASGTNFTVGTTTVTCSATDAHNNTGQAGFHVTVTLVDTTAPVVTVPSDISTTTTLASGKSVSFAASATDNIDGPLTPSCSPASGTNFPVGTTTVTCSATDAHGNTGSKSFNVTVTLVDTTKPVVTVPANITQEATSSSGTIVNFPPATANDNIDGAITPTCSPASGTSFPLGPTTVTCSATDAHGNTGTGSFKVTLVDTTNPVVTVPADITQEATSSGGATVTFPPATANDNIDGAITPTCSPASGTNFPLGTTTVTCSATDKSGNKGTGSFHVTVEDTTGPTVTVPTDQTREANGPAGAVVTFTASASDIVDGPLMPAAITCLPVSGSTFPLGKTTVTCSASDAHGNPGHSSFAVTVVDTTPPRMNIPAAITLSSPNSLPSSDPTISAFLGSANATDLVDGTVRVSNNAPGSFPIGTTTVTFTATDKAGNKTVASSTVTVTVAAVPPPPPPDTKPPAPVGKLAASVSDGVVKLTWLLPGDSDFDHVTVEQSSEGSPLSVVYTGSGTSFTAKRLKNGVEYRFVVVSYDKTGNASAEAAIVATPAVAMLVQPKNGAVTTKAPLLDWRDVTGAAYYNVQLYRLPATAKTTGLLPSGSKILSIWPTKSSLRLSLKWVYGKKHYQLSPGTYVWFVWAGFGPRSDVKYGPLLGQSSFVFHRH
jgi:large repetitive protein